MRRLLIALCLVATTAHAALEMVGGAQDKFLLIRLYATDGTAKTALSYTDMTITYTRNNASADADVTEATMTMGTHVDGGFVEVDATNSPGLYQFGIPDAAIADGAEEVTFSFNATGVVPVSKSVSLIDVDLRNGPNVAANTVTVEGGDATDALGVAQTGDAYARLGAPAGASHAADIAAIKTDSGNLITRVGTPSNLGGGATVAGNLADIESQTDDIGAAGAGLTGIAAVGAVTGNVGGNVAGSVGSLGAQAKLDVNAEADAALADVGLTTTVTGRIDAAVSTRSTYAGGDTAGTTTLLSRLTSTRAGLLDNLDAAVSTRSTYAGGDTSGTTTLLSRLTAIRAGLLDNLDVAVSTRLATSGYTAPLDATATRAALGLTSANLDTQLADIPTVAELNARTLPSADYATAANLATLYGILDTEFPAAAVILGKLDTGLELDGAVYRWTANALEQAPTGTGGGGGEVTLADGSITAAKLAADAVTLLQSAGNITSVNGEPVTGVDNFHTDLSGLGTIEEFTAAVVPGVLDALLADHDTAGTVGAGISAAAAAAPTGSILITNLRVVSGGLPVADALVEFSTDNAKANVVQRSRTDMQGYPQPPIQLNPGTYYQWTTKAGMSFTNPIQRVVPEP
jgi:hypothetical protein